MIGRHVGINEDDIIKFMVDCTFENGNEASLRHVVMDAIVVKENKILLIKRAPHLSNPGKYGLPGGYLDLDETITKGIKREILEETGYESKSVKLVKIIDEPNRKGEDRQNVEFSFVVEPGEKVAEPDDESSAVKWFDLGNLPDEKDFAFDHYDIVQLYLKNKNTTMSNLE